MVKRTARRAASFTVLEVIGAYQIRRYPASLGVQLWHQGTFVAFCPLAEDARALAAMGVK